ncbi:hypothetical protein BKI52_23780 [marine bacterium AO1-C]|nr:hypothetical protein BKI52_23780 [marine bacterium AO1-C]
MKFSLKISQIILEKCQKKILREDQRGKLGIITHLEYSILRSNTYKIIQKKDRKSKNQSIIV